MISISDFIYLFLFVLIGYLILKPMIQIIILKIKYGQKVQVHFFPIIGLFAKMIYGQIFKGDIIAYKKESIKAHPDMKAYITTIYGSKLWYIITDVDLMKQGLQNIELYQKVEFLPYMNKTFKLGLAFTEGEKWKNQRKLIAQQFTFNKLQNRCNQIKKIAEKVYSQEIENGQKSHILHASTKIAATVVLETFFGSAFSQELDKSYFIRDTVIQGKSAVEQFSYFITEWGIMSLFDTWVLLRTTWLGYNDYDSIPKWMLTKKDKELYLILLEIRKHMKQIIQERIDNREHYKNNNQDDFLQVYVDELIKNPDKITVEEIIHQFITFFFAGMDTTGHLVAVAVYALAKYPEIQEELRTSLQKISPNYSELNINDLNQLKILGNFINETLRVYPPADALFARKVMKDHKLGFLQLKRGDMVEFSMIHSQYNPKYFENPEKFDINRWDDERINKDRQNSWFQQVFSFASIPFSAGPRNCIGQHMAQIEAKFMLSYLVLNYRMQLDESKKFVMTFKLMYEPTDDTYVKFIKI